VLCVVGARVCHIVQHIVHIQLVPAANSTDTHAHNVGAATSWPNVTSQMQTLKPLRHACVSPRCTTSMLQHNGYASCAMDVLPAQWYASSRPCEVDPAPLCDLCQALGPKGALCVDVQCLALSTTHVNGQLRAPHVQRQTPVNKGRDTSRYISDCGWPTGATGRGQIGKQVRECDAQTATKCSCTTVSSHC
jgi:hypothetical protein